MATKPPTRYTHTATLCPDVFPQHMTTKRDFASPVTAALCTTQDNGASPLPAPFKSPQKEAKMVTNQWMEWAALFITKQTQMPNVEIIMLTHKFLGI